MSDQRQIHRQPFDPHIIHGLKRGMVLATPFTMRAHCLPFLLAAMLLAPTALAEDQERPKRRPTHFIGEVAGGSHIQGAGTFTWGALLGVGGKPRNVPARFYLVAAFQRTHDRKTFVTDASQYSYDLDIMDADFGLRVYFPIARGLRITTEAMLGATLMDAEMTDLANFRTHQNLSMPHLLLGIGPQVRLIHELSLGVMARTLFSDTDRVRPSGALAPWKSDLSQRTHVTGTLTFHW